MLSREQVAKNKKALTEIYNRIRERSAEERNKYVADVDEKFAKLQEAPARAGMACPNQAHMSAASDEKTKEILSGNVAKNGAIISGYSDVLSAHQPFKDYPDIIKACLIASGMTAQVAAGVASMCDGITQGEIGMQLSLFSRDVIAQSVAIALSHGFDFAVLMGVCDKIAPGMVMGVLAEFGYLAAVFAPAGPMVSGTPDKDKKAARIKQAKLKKEISQLTIDDIKDPNLTDEEKVEALSFVKAGLLKQVADDAIKVEMGVYHAPGTCTFYGTANTNQMILEAMGLHLPGASFVNPNTPLRFALTEAAAKRAAELNVPIGRILDEKAFVNGIAVLMATGGSTNDVMHLIAMAEAAGIWLTYKDFEDISEIVPQLVNIYPNNDNADINDFQAAGGTAVLFGNMLDAGLMFEDVETVAGRGMHLYRQQPKLVVDASADPLWQMDEKFVNGTATIKDYAESKVKFSIEMVDGPSESLDTSVIRSADEPFKETGGIKIMHGLGGQSIVKKSSLDEEQMFIEAPVLVFNDQESVQAAYNRGDLDRDCVVVVRAQSANDNGMPELHKLIAPLAELQKPNDKRSGYTVALVTNGRLSGASGTVPAAIHQEGDWILKVQDGDVLRMDVHKGTMELPYTNMNEFWRRPNATIPLNFAYERSFGPNRRNAVPSSFGGGQNSRFYKKNPPLPQPANQSQPQPMAA